MFILVRHTDNVIIGTAIRKVDENQASGIGYKVFEINDEDFTPELIGTVLEGFDEAENG